MAHEACADEGIKAGITLALACLGVDGCVRFGTTELLLEARLPVTEGGKVFFGRHCGHSIGRDVGMSGGVSGSIGIGLGGEKDAFGLDGSGFEAVLALQFLACGGVALPVTRMADGVRFGSGLVDDATFVVAINFAAVDDATLAEGAADVADRVLIVDGSHIIYDLRF